MEEEERLMGGLQRALDRVHSTDHEMVAQAQEANKMISALRDGHDRIRSPLETARAMNDDNQSSCRATGSDLPRRRLKPTVCASWRGSWRRAELMPSPILKEPPQGATRGRSYDAPKEERRGHSTWMR